MEELCPLGITAENNIATIITTNFKGSLVSYLQSTKTNLPLVDRPLPVCHYWTNTFNFLKSTPTGGGTPNHPEASSLQGLLFGSLTTIWKL